MSPFIFCTELDMRIACLDEIVERMVDDSKASDVLDAYIAGAVCSN